MRILLTGATGYIGSAVAQALKAANHQVVGLARSPESAHKLADSGVEPLPGDLRKTMTLANGARDADGVIHAGMEWSSEMGAIDQAAVVAMLGAIAGTGKPFIYTSGSWLMGDTGEQVVNEDAASEPAAVVAWRPAVEELVNRSAGRNIRGVVIRPVMVYGRDGGEMANMLQTGKEKGVVRFVGSGENHWSFVHIDALASLYLLALDKGAAGATYVASSGEHRPVKEVAEAAANAVGARAEAWPMEEARETLGPKADGLIMDQRIVVSRPQEQLGWSHNAPGVLEELASGV